MQAKLTTKPSELKDYELRKRCDSEWRRICNTPVSPCDPQIEAFLQEFPNIKPEPFRWSRRKVLRLAYEALRGRAGTGGPLGKLRHLAGGPLQLNRVSAKDIGLEAFDGDAFAQFEPEIAKMFFDTLEQHMGGVPFWAVFEFGRIEHKPHFHIYTKQGACPIGVNNGVALDDELLEKTAYLLKPPVWNELNRVGYVTVKHAYPGMDIAQRVSCRGLPNKRTQVIGIQEIEVALGFGLSKPSDVEPLTKKELEVFEVVGESLDLPSMDITQPKLGTKISEVLEVAEQCLQRREKPTPPIIQDRQCLQRRENDSSESQCLQRKGVEAGLQQTLESKQPQEPSPDSMDWMTPEDFTRFTRLCELWESGSFDGQPGPFLTGFSDDLGKSLSPFMPQGDDCISGTQVYILTLTARALNLEAAA
jgi:hypothetical protein